MIIIMSSAYVSDEFQAEIGKIPPTLLPIGNKKLIEHQVESLRKIQKNERIILSLPESFILSKTLEQKLLLLEIELCFIPDRFTLSEAVLYVLNTSDIDVKKLDSISILYGDTYISDMSFMAKYDDLVAIAEAKTSYAWEYIDIDANDNLVWCGFFKFSNFSYLLKSLALNRENFNAAVKTYAQYEQMALIQTQYWHDLGHINTYFLARAQITTQRSFNELNIFDGIVHKSGEPQIKIQAEANWFQSVPPTIKKFIPLLIDSGVQENKFGYDLEYLSCMPLNELFVHGYNAPRDWYIIFSKTQEFFQASQKVKLSSIDQNMISQDFSILVREKTFSRLNQYSLDANVNIESPLFYEDKKLPSALAMAEHCVRLIEELPSIPSIQHGDLCFSNMLFDPRSLKLKVLDPRGLNFNNELTIYGDAKYDLAKLTHSVIGLYDFIISGNYRILNPDSRNVSLCFDIDERIETIQHDFYHMCFFKDVSVQQIIPLVILLFLSMLPLHNDRPDRQKAMWLNALRLYVEFVMKA